MTKCRRGNGALGRASECQHRRPSRHRKRRLAPTPRERMLRPRRGRPRAKDRCAPSMPPRPAISPVTRHGSLTRSSGTFVCRSTRTSQTRSRSSPELVTKRDRSSSDTRSVPRGGESSHWTLRPSFVSRPSSLAECARADRRPDADHLAPWDADAYSPAPCHGSRRRRACAAALARPPARRAGPRPPSWSPGRPPAECRRLGRSDARQSRRADRRAAAGRGSPVSRRAHPDP